MYIKSIRKNSVNKITVNLVPLKFEEIKLFNKDFKKTQEFKNLVSQKFIKEVTEEDFNEYISNKKQSNPM